MSICSKCHGPCEYREQLYVTDCPLVLHGSFCVHCCIALGWASDTILSEPDPDDDDSDELVD